MLYIVSTPIGNLADITYRAVNILKEVDYIAAEDTRHSKKLLNHYEIDTALLSYHSHSSSSKVEKIIDLLLEGKKVALISDAGTPGISDPAYSLITAAAAQNIEVIPVPGASSLLAAAVKSALPINQFVYLGFLPIKKGRQTLLNNLKEEKRSLIIFESPHRLIKSLSQFKEFFADRSIAVCRELTKIHEEVFRGRIEEALDYFQSKKPKGEFVLILGPPGKHF
jgi:16S rRNA (cytidine1402-2'-O)-methyltransferase